jgi:hypothetical protein
MEEEIGKKRKQDERNDKNSSRSKATLKYEIWQKDQRRHFQSCGRSKR